MESLLEVQNLHVSYHTRNGEVCPALAGVSFALKPGEILGVLGESGSGKSTVAAGVVQLLPPNARIANGRVLFEGTDVLKASAAELQKIRGGRIGLMFQEPSSALHPMLRAGQQVTDVLAAHYAMTRHALHEKTRQVLAKVFAPEDVDRISRSYPHELSGGQRQRVLLAQAVACEPSMLIADEPTASLDPTTQQEMLLLFRTLQRESELSMILITHNPALLFGIADRVLMLYAGRVAEIGPAEAVFASARHPYTQALLQCMPPPFASQGACPKGKLRVISGESPQLSEAITGCRFEPRCESRMAICKSAEPAGIAVGEFHDVSCYKYAS